MSDQTDKAQQPPPDMMQLWRDWLTQTDRQFTALFSQMTGSDAFSRGMGTNMEVSLAFQKMLADGMERYLKLINMPSRNDVIGLGETLRAMETRLANIEEMFRIAAETDSGRDDREAAASEPRRTRRPAGMPAGVETVDELREAEAIPEQLRR